MGVLTLYITIGGILLLLSLVLFCPFSYYLSLALTHELIVVVKIGSPLFRLIFQKKGRRSSVESFILGWRLPKKGSTKKRKEIKKEPKKESKKKESSPFPLSLINRALLGHVVEFLVDLLKILKPKVFYLHGKVGFDEPEINGLAQAFYHLFKVALPAFPLQFETVWDQELFHIKGQLRGRVLPARFLGKVLFFLLSKKTLVFFYQLQKRRKNFRAGRLLGIGRFVNKIRRT